MLKKRTDFPNSSTGEAMYYRYMKRTLFDAAELLTRLQEGNSTTQRTSDITDIIEQADICELHALYVEDPTEETKKAYDEAEDAWRLRCMREYLR